MDKDGNLIQTEIEDRVISTDLDKLRQLKNVVGVAGADYGRRLNLDRFRELRPDGYIQCGIAEQNLIEVASACNSTLNVTVWSKLSEAIQVQTTTLIGNSNG